MVRRSSPIESTMTVAGDLGADMPAVLKAARPLLLTGRLLGLCPLSTGPAGDRGLRPSLGWRLYSWALTGFMTALMSLALYTGVPGNSLRESRKRGTNTSFRADIFVYTMTCLNDTVAVTLLVLANVKARSAATAFNQLVQCQAAMPTLESLGRGAAWRAVLQVALVVFILVAYLVGAGIFFSVEDPELLEMAHILTLPVQLFFCLLFGNQVCLLWLLVRSMNRRLQVSLDTELPRSRGMLPPRDAIGVSPATLPGARWAEQRLKSKGPGMSPVDVQTLRLMHSQVRHALTLLCTAHGLEVVIMVLMTFVCITTSLYIYLIDTGGQDDGSLLALAWSCLVGLMVFGVLTVGELVKRESRCTVELTQRTLIYQQLSPGLRQEMRGFSQQLMHEGMQVSAYGFLPLDYTMLQGMIGSVTTYLIMVIQLSPEGGVGNTEQRESNTTNLPTEP